MISTRTWNAFYLLYCVPLLDLFSLSRLHNLKESSSQYVVTGNSIGIAVLLSQSLLCLWYITNSHSHISFSNNLGFRVITLHRISRLRKDNDVKLLVSLERIGMM
jgi:hypothetical protein